MTLSRAFYGEREIIRVYLGLKAIPLSLIINVSALAGLLTGAATGRYVSPDAALPCTLAGGATGERNAAHVEASVIADRTDGGILAGQTAYGIVDTLVNGEVLGGELIGHRADEGVVSDAPSLGGAIGGSGAGHQVEAHRTDTAVLPGGKSGGTTGGLSGPVPETAISSASSVNAAATGHCATASVSEPMVMILAGKYGSQNDVTPVTEWELDVPISYIGEDEAQYYANRLYTDYRRIGTVWGWFLIDENGGVFAFESGNKWQILTNDGTFRVTADTYCTQSQFNTFSQYFNLISY